MEFLAAPREVQGLTRRSEHESLQRHGAFVWTYLRMLGADAAQADDLTQEAFVVLLGRAERPEWPRAFLKETARRLFLAARRSQPLAAELLDAVDEAWEAQVRRDDDPWLRALAECREHLDGRRRRAVALYYGEQLTLGAVAKRLGMKTNGVKTLLQRVREDLRDCIRRKLP